MHTTFYIVVDSFIEFSTESRVIGGTESWTAALIDLAMANNSRVVIFQYNSNFRIRNQRFKYVEFELITWSTIRELRKTLREERKKNKGVLFVYGDRYLPDRNDLPCILIHHGIGNDGTSDAISRGKVHCFLADIRRKYLWFKDARSLLSYYQKFSKVVCVDTNIINQFRYAWPMYDSSELLVYIPNWGEILSESEVFEKWQNKSSKTIVLFARRFRYVRGAKLWIDCLNDLAPVFPEVEFHCVGHGSHYKDFQELSDKFRNVIIYSKPYVEMKDVYAKSHISVVPSLWSEGTSLSALESMGAGCAVVASNVGGLGNIIFDGVNGLLIQPSAKEFSFNVRYLLENLGHAAEIGNRSYEIAKAGFSKAVWQKRMTEIIKEALMKPEAQKLKRRVH